MDKLDSYVEATEWVGRGYVKHEKKVVGFYYA